MFYGELELSNPLGTHVKKDKLAVLLYTFGNIHSKHHSSLRMINPLVCTTLPGMDSMKSDQTALMHARLQHPFVIDLKVLFKVGVIVLNGGNEQIFRGDLLLCLGDNLEAIPLEVSNSLFPFHFIFVDIAMLLTTHIKLFQTI